MTARRFSAGQTFTFDGIKFRVVEGVKRQKFTGKTGDLRVDWWSEELRRWVPIRMQTVGFLVDFFFENEDFLYPPHLGFKGGEKVMKYLRHAVRHGFEKAEAGLRAEREMKDQPGLFDGDAFNEDDAA